MFSTVRSQSYGYDSLNRLNSKSLSTDNPLNINYTYKLSRLNSTGQETYRTYNIHLEIIGNKAYRYTYDKLGNITKIEQGIRTGTNTAGSYVTKLEYKYDSQNQLVRVDDYDQNYTFTYSYDTNGNMEYSYKYVLGSTSTGDLRGLDTNSYDSTWSDKLTYSTKVGAITYDAIGNPLKYGNNTLSWTGRQLDSFVGTGTNIGYKYDSDGMRVSKTVNGVKSEYYYVDGKLYYEKRGSKELFYNYGNDGNLLRIRLSENGSDLYYYAACNMRGDVVALYKGDGGIKAEYKYDAWGKVLSVTDANGNEITDANNIGLLNPIRYRGYYYDAETGFYYLQSRYYDPEIGRFISVEPNVDNGEFDEESEIIGYNLFAYCFNNPVNNFDPDGEAVANIVGGIVGGATGATLGYLLAKKLRLTGWKKWALISAATIGGAALGAFLGPYMAKLGSRVVARLGIKSVAKQTIKSSSRKLWKGCEKHIFSRAHIKNGIMRLGGSKRSIFNKVYRVVNSNLGNAVNGSNQIHTTINGVKTTIRFYVSNGQVQSIDAFTGWATRIIGKLL